MQPGGPWEVFVQSWGWPPLYPNHPYLNNTDCDWVVNRRLWYPKRVRTSSRCRKCPWNGSQGSAQVEHCTAPRFGPKVGPGGTPAGGEAQVSNTYLGSNTLFLGRRQIVDVGRLDAQHRRFPVGPYTMYLKPKCRVWGHGRHQNAKTWKAPPLYHAKASRKAPEGKLAGGHLTTIPCKIASERFWHNFVHMHSFVGNPSRYILVLGPMGLQ